MAPYDQHETQFKEDVTAGMQETLRVNPRLSHTDALKLVTADMLANNPFIPPKGCPVNELPSELLAHIFYVGTKMEEEEADHEDDFEDEDDTFDLADGWEDTEDEMEMDIVGSFPDAGSGKPSKIVVDAEESDEDDSSEDDPTPPFQVLVSHVCSHWRSIAVDTPSLWTNIMFQKGSSLEQAKSYIHRSKGLPIDIYIDCLAPNEWGGPAEDIFELGEDVPGSFPATTMEMDETLPKTPPALPFLDKDELVIILDMIVPHIERWRTIEVLASLYESVHAILSRLSQCTSAPMLEALQFYHYEDCEDFDIFEPTNLNERFLLFNGNAPKLRDVAMWGVHLDWEASLPLLSNLTDFELAYHANDVRPSYQTLRDILDNCPELHTLSLCLSGPAGTAEDWETELISVPTVKSLVLAHHDPKYVEALFPRLCVPNVVDLTISFDSEDYSVFAKMLTEPQWGRKNSLLDGLEHMKISGLPCDKKTRIQMLEQLGNVIGLNLNCSGDEEEFFDLLMELGAKGTSRAGKVMYCPRMDRISTIGIDGKKMRKFVETRKSGGATLKKVMMSEQDDVSSADESWLRERLDFEYFEPSDSEDDIFEEGDEDDDFETD